MEWFPHNFFHHNLVLLLLGNGRLLWGKAFSRVNGLSKYKWTWAFIHNKKPFIGKGDRKGFPLPNTVVICMCTLQTWLIHLLSSGYLAGPITTQFSGLHCFVRLMVWSEICLVKCLLWGNFVDAQLKELRCFWKPSLPQIKQSISFPEGVLKLQSTMQGAKWCPKYKLPVPGALHPRWEEYNLQRSTTAPVDRYHPDQGAVGSQGRPSWEPSLPSTEMDSETSAGWGPQPGAGTILQAAVLCPNVWPLILTSLNHLSNEVPVIRGCFLCWKVNCFGQTKNFKFSTFYKALYLLPVSPSTITSCHLEL